MYFDFINYIIYVLCKRWRAHLSVNASITIIVIRRRLELLEVVAGERGEGARLLTVEASTGGRTARTTRRLEAFLAHAQPNVEANALMIAPGQGAGVVAIPLAVLQRDQLLGQCKLLLFTTHFLSHVRLLLGYWFVTFVALSCRFS